MASGRKPLGDELADRVEHSEPGAVIGIETDEAVTGQCLGQVKRPILIHARDLGGRVHRPAVDEDRRYLEQ